MNVMTVRLNVVDQAQGTEEQLGTVQYSTIPICCIELARYLKNI